MDIEVLYEDDDIFVLNKPDKLTMNKDGEKAWQISCLICLNKEILSRKLDL